MKRDDAAKDEPFADLQKRTLSLELEITAPSEPATFRMLIESIQDYAIFMLDPAGIVATWNLGAERIKGYEAREIIGQHFSRFYPPEDVASGKGDTDLEVATRDGSFEDEGWRVRKDGTRFWANVAITALRTQEGKLVGFAKVTRDLTERRKAEDERLRLAQLQEASRLKDQFLATISHELRTPLNAIYGWATILKSESDPAVAERAIETILRNAEAQITIVEDMLDLSRIVAGKMRIEVRQVDMQEIVRDALEVVRPAADARDLELMITGSEDPMVLVGDPVRLQQTAWNLLSNAVKFSTRGGSVTVSLQKVDSAIEFRVTDTGRGIDPNFLPHIFEAFRQADMGAARRVGGVGLGLAIVKHIVDLHGGQITVESEGLGQGASFTVRFPIRTGVPVERGTFRIPPARGYHDRQLRLDGVRVLAVDDEPDARDLLDAIFRLRGARVALAGSAAEARQALEAFRPAVIVSDVGMPGENGYEFLRSVRARSLDEGGATPAVALSAYAYREDRRRALDAGFNYHLAKPVDHEELVRIVHNLVTVVGTAGTPWRKFSSRN